jgi:hypothetical protein
MEVMAVPKKKVGPSLPLLYPFFLIVYLVLLYSLVQCSTKHLKLVMMNNGGDLQHSVLCAR